MSLLLLFRGGGASAGVSIVLTVTAEVFVPLSMRAAAIVPAPLDAEAFVPSMAARVHVPEEGDAVVYVMPAVKAVVKGSAS